MVGGDSGFLRKRASTTVVAGAMLISSLWAVTTDPPTVPPRKDYAATVAALEPFIEHEVRDKQLPALSVALVDGSEIVWARGFGFADPDRKIPATATTVYRIGSVSKLFTDIGIMQMVEAGRIDLDAPVERYLPEFKPANQFGKPITLRQLMSHRSGLMREPPVGHYFDPTGPTLADTVRSINGYPLVYEPETHTKYSNAAVGVVGYTLEYMNKQPFARYLKDAVLRPLGLRSSSFEPEPAIRQQLAKAYMWSYERPPFVAPTFELGMAPAGCMYSTPIDLARFIMVLLNHGQAPDGQRVVKPETLEKMWTPQFGPGSPFGIGFVLSTINGHRVVGHAGAIYGFATEVDAMPEDGIGAVVVTTMDSANAVAARIANEALRQMHAAKTKQVPRAIETTSPIPAAVMHRRAGRYGDGDDAIDLVEEHGELYLRGVRGGYQLRLRQLNDTMVVDDRIGYGARIVPGDDRITVGGVVLKRGTTGQTAAVIPDSWKGLIGDYGWDHDILFINARDGRLMCLIEWFDRESLEQVSTDVFRYPAHGLYENETIVFTRGANGVATQVRVGGVVFPRRPAGRTAGPK